jgi:hypothetical protein
MNAGPSLGPAVTMAMPVIPANTRPVIAQSIFRVIELLLLIETNNAPKLNSFAIASVARSEMRGLHQSLER